MIHIWSDSLGFSSMFCFVSVLFSLSLCFPCLSRRCLHQITIITIIRLFDDDWQLRKGGMKPAKINSNQTHKSLMWFNFWPWPSWVPENHFRQSANFGSNYSGLKSKYSCKSVDDCCRQRNDEFSYSRQRRIIEIRMEWSTFQNRADKHTHAGRIILANHIVIIVGRTINSWGQINTQK